MKALPRKPGERSYLLLKVDLPRVSRRSSTDRVLSDFLDLEWHTISPGELFRRLSTTISEGLSTEQARRRLTEYGKNDPSSPPSHRFEQIFGYFFKGFGPILFIGSILVFVSWKPLGQPPALANLALAIVLFAVFLIQAGFNAWQDWSSSRVMASITTMLPDNCLLMRDSAQVMVITSDIVPGDILFIKSGNKLPADVRFVETSSDAKFDRSILTGTSALTTPRLFAHLITWHRRIITALWHSRLDRRQLPRNALHWYARHTLHFWECYRCRSQYW